MPNLEYRFDQCVLQPADRRMYRDGAAIAVGPRAFDLLLHLVVRQGQLVQREELLRCIWHGLVVEEGNLHVQVSNLRKVLGPAAIETVQGVGYRFVPEVTTASASRVRQEGNLPTPLTRFIGRHKELAALAEALQRTRLLTLTGLGGAGKTRLALQLALMEAPLYAGHVWFIEMGAVAAGHSVAQCVADAMAVRAQPGQPTADALQLLLSGRGALLVLDSCEHLAATATAQIGHLLESIYDLRVVATSRSPLGIAGEARFPVTPLSLDPGVDVHSDAVQLFVDRARQVAPDLELDARAMEAVESLCRRLDGLPVAIELAAGTLSVVSLHTLIQLLADRFALLRPVTLADGTKSLDDILAWSFERLAPEDRTALATWSVFAGSWTLAAAVAVTGPTVVAPSQIVACLSRLVDCALVQVEPAVDGERRYRLLDSVREFAQRVAVASNALEPARARHFAFYMALAEANRVRAVPQPLPLATLHALDEERDNIEVAHAWAGESVQRHAAGLSFVAALESFWSDRHFTLNSTPPSFDGIVQGARLAAEALARPGAQAPTTERLRALRTAGRMAHLQGDHAAASRSLQEALVVAHVLDAHPQVVSLHCSLSVTALNRGDLSAARVHAERAYAVAQPRDDAFSRMSALRAMAEAAYRGGDIEASERYLLEAMPLVPEGDKRWVAALTLRLARAALALGRTMDCTRLVREVVEGGLVAADAREANEALHLAAALAERQDESEIAQRFRAAAMQIERSCGFPPDPSFASLSLMGRGYSSGQPASDATQGMPVTTVLKHWIDTKSSGR